MRDSTVAELLLESEEQPSYVHLSQRSWEQLLSRRPVSEDRFSLLQFSWERLLSRQAATFAAGFFGATATFTDGFFGATALETGYLRMAAAFAAGFLGGAFGRVFLGTVFAKTAVLAVFPTPFGDLDRVQGGDGNWPLTAVFFFAPAGLLFCGDLTLTIFPLGWMGDLDLELELVPLGDGEAL